MRKNCGKTTSIISSYQSYRLGQNILMRLKTYWEPKFNTLYLQWTHKYVSNILKINVDVQLNTWPFPFPLDTQHQMYGCVCPTPTSCYTLWSGWAMLTTLSVSPCRSSPASQWQHCHSQDDIIKDGGYLSWLITNNKPNQVIDFIISQEPGGPGALYQSIEATTNQKSVWSDKSQWEAKK